MKFSIVLFIVLLLSFGISSAQAQSIPDWIKNTAGWWSEGQIGDTDFLSAIEFLVNEDIIKISQVKRPSEKSDMIPDWIKNTAGWWSEGQIGDTDFVSGIQFLISKGMISVKASSDFDLTRIGNFDLSNAGPFEGEKDAPFTIIMVTDPQCKTCVEWITHEKEVISQKLIEPGIAKFFFLNYPVIGDDSISASEATFCANEQGKYFEYIEILHENFSGIQTGWASHESLISYAEELGLNVESFDHCLFWDKYTIQIDSNRNIANANGVVTTPTFFVIGPDDTTKRVVGKQPSMIFEKLIQDMS